MLSPPAKLKKLFDWTMDVHFPVVGEMGVFFLFLK